MSAAGSAGTLLFAPGNRPERFDKAIASGADLVVVDLEDAVPPSAKAGARAIVRDRLAADTRLAVRVNASGTEWFEADVAAVVGRAAALVLPPLWHWVALARWHGAWAGGPDGHPRTGGFLPDLGKPRRMFAGGRVDLRAPLRVGMS